jgi:hypothetical protein
MLLKGFANRQFPIKASHPLRSKGCTACPFGPQSDPQDALADEMA